MNEEKCELISKHNAYRHLTKDGKYLVCHFSPHNYIHKLEDEIKQLQNNWNELNRFVEERIKFVQEEKAEFEEDLYNNYETNRTEIIIRRCELTQLEDVQERMQELEGNNE